MTTRSLVQSIMNYGEFDRMPVLHWGQWDETKARWVSEGMPADLDEGEYFGAVGVQHVLGANLNLLPAFEEEVLQETQEYRIFRNTTGVVQKVLKSASTLPQFLDYTLKTASDWDDYKKRLQPNPERIPDDIDERIGAAENSGMPIAIWTGSMMGWIRDWMGVENMSYLMFDSRDVYEDMVNTSAELVCWSIDQILPRMHTQPDWGFGWEDICFKNGPLVSPSIFESCVAGGYRKIRSKLEEYGVRVYGLDSDGYIEPLLKNWLDAGVNMQFPVEIGTWDADPMDLRRKFGKELLMIGGFNKLVLEDGPEKIDAEIDRRMEIMRDGGFLIMPDHWITPGVSLENYKYYLDRIRTLRL